MPNNPGDVAADALLDKLEADLARRVLSPGMALACAFDAGARWRASRGPTVFPVKVPRGPALAVGDRATYAIALNGADGLACVAYQDAPGGCVRMHRVSDGRYMTVATGDAFERPRHRIAAELAHALTAYWAWAAEAVGDAT